MIGIIRIKKKHALVAIMAVCSVFSFLLGFTVRAEMLPEGNAHQSEEGELRKGDELQVDTGLEAGFASMGFTCLDTDYQGGYLFLADEVIPYPLCVRYAASDNGYTESDIRTWLNQYFADTLSVADKLQSIRLSEAEDSVHDRVFCLSVDEVKNPDYMELTRKAWNPERGRRYYWTRSKRENTTNQAYMVQYNGHIASSRVSLTEAGIRPAFVLKRAEKDTSQGKIWYEGDTQERMIQGETYTFRCVDPNYSDAGKNRAGALFLCDTIIGGNECRFDEAWNAWETSELRSWLNAGIEDVGGMAEVVTTISYTYAGKSYDYQPAERTFTKRVRPGTVTKDRMFCLSLEEALRYSGRLWKLNGSATDNFTKAGAHSMGYWLRTPSAGNGNTCYAVTYDGRVAAEAVDHDRIGIRPAFVAVQE